MAYLLYRNGNKHIIWGKECEYKQFADEDVEQALTEGWVLHPKELQDEKLIDDEVLEAEFEEVGELSSSDVRLAAENAGIEGFKTKRIATLKKELEA